jgi:DNA topoisomerase-3
MVNYLQVNAPYAMGVGFTPDVEHITNDAKVTDHHGLLPTMEIAAADLEALPAGEAAVLSLVAARLLCATASAHKYEAVAVSVTCGGHTFKVTGKTVLTDGWKAIDAAYKACLKEKPKTDKEPAALPMLESGQTISPVSAVVEDGKTTPPARFTEDTLLSAMERAGAKDTSDAVEHKGLGTPATRAGVIEKLVRGGFVQRQKRQLVPTTKGTNLVAVLPEAVKSPALTAEWEEKLLRIERGQLAPEAFMQGIAEMVAGLVRDHQTPVEGKKALFAAPPGEVVGVCPRCGKDVREGRKGFFCADKSCGFALWKNDRFFSARGASLTKATAAALLKRRACPCVQLRVQKDRQAVRRRCGAGGHREVHQFQARLFRRKGGQGWKTAPASVS